MLSTTNPSYTKREDHKMRERYHNKRDVHTTRHIVLKITLPLPFFQQSSLSSEPLRLRTETTTFHKNKLRDEALKADSRQGISEIHIITLISVTFLATTSGTNIQLYFHMSGSSMIFRISNRTVPHNFYQTNRPRLNFKCR